MLPALATRFAVATALISAVAGGVAEDPTTLRESSAVVSRVPLFSKVGDTQCDADGNFYFNTSLSPSDRGLLKVAHDGSKFHLYKLPARDADSKYYHFREFNVTPSGELRVLAYESDSVPYLFHFDSDLGDTSKLKLELPEHF